MAEKEYIDRNTVCEKLNAIGGCGAECDSWADGWDKAIEEAINIVNSVPSENTVEVVRCKDCIHVDNGYIGHLYCRIFNSMPVSGMDYCKWGEQKVSTSEKEVAVKHGHWIEEYDCGYITPHCSECGETALTKEETSYDYVYSSYCPRCGAKLDKTE